ncbi:Serine arginine-rich splicing factor 2 [Cyanidiococcus yangmingshanensis]|uniref:Serine arginine-rich splicing factor 2 n=1 Tax=Cyanidiococcus yangmingshanensis TaxID=2690220 RepID=A0A7J7IFH7_9RHOD|nr:Serine arginine-rich splicing factor 2 [Cyanidiococcus yangmingshanensis]
MSEREQSADTAPAGLPAGNAAAGGSADDAFPGAHVGNENVAISTPTDEQQQQKSSRPFPNRPSEIQLKSSVGLMVRNIPFGTRQEDLLELFSPFGDVVDIFIPWDRYLRRIRGFAFVRMQTVEQAEAAITALDGSTMRDRIIAVKRAEYERGEGPPAQQTTPGGSRRGRGGRPRSGEFRGSRRRRPRSNSAGGSSGVSRTAQGTDEASGMTTES